MMALLKGSNILLVCLLFIAVLFSSGQEYNATS